MEIAIVSIGNSKGIRLTKSILKQYNITDSVELILEKGFIVLKPTNLPRKGWAESFEKMHKNGDDSLLIQDIFEDEDFDKWN
jgi:antitoxin MazE